MSDVETICTFTLDSLFLGIEVGSVHEVLLAQPLNPVPLAHPAVEGLINMRGQIVAAVDLRRVLHLPPRAEDAPAPVNVIVRSNHGLISLLVDQVGDVLEIESRFFTPPPDAAPAETRNFFRGAYQLPGQLLLVFDTIKAIDAIVSQVCTRP
ncbi:MAG: chemotaxis protein CheW [Planctomycetota bacterium]|nr:chemotaxis protein CheW [Planctomycetota bacterium]